MRFKHLLLLGVGASMAFVIGYGAVAKAWPFLGRNEHYGYFQNDFDAYGSDVWPDTSNTPGCSASGGNALPSGINTPLEFTNFVKCKLTSTNSSATVRSMERTGAAFIIQSMLNDHGAKITSTSDPRVAEWEDRIYFAEMMNWINWSTPYSYTINSYWQGSGAGNNYNDDAFFGEVASGTAITFRNASGTVVYGIRKQCANPVGTTNLAPIPNNPVFNMSGTSRASAPGVPEAQNISVPLGTQVTFRHRLTASGATSPATIAWGVYRPAGPLYDSGNAGTFTSGQTKLVSTEVVTPLSTGVHCRFIRWDPDTQNGGFQDSGAACVTVTESYDLTPSITVQINGGAVTGNRAEPGDSITFRYAVDNDGGTGNNIDCTIYGRDWTGYHAIPSPPDSTSGPGYTPPPGVPGCPRDFPDNAVTSLGSETVTAVANRSVCRSLFVDPATPGGPPLGVEACAYVVSKPYARIYGGDVAAGTRFESSPGTCTGTIGDNAAIIGWNKRSGGSYAGAGVQHAALARGAIFDFASSLGGGAAPPAALSFTNTSTNAANGNFGGLFDWAPCVPDFYSAAPPPTITTDINVSTLTTGEYGGTGDLIILGGNVNPGQRITLYIDGDAYITGNIVYAGSWSIGQMPMFRLVVRGNIYVDNDVSRLDGMYVAQANSAGSYGIIVTCATGFATPTLDGTLQSTCDNTKLTINGSLVARHIRLTRTAGTLRQSAAGEASTSPHISETFNYGPIMWIPQPAPTATPSDYDAITSLPPVL